MALAAIIAALDDIEAPFAKIVDLYDETPSLQDRTCSTGIVAADLVRQWAAGGYVGRASSRDFDARRDLAYPPYQGLRFEVPVLGTGDVDARLRVRVAEIGASMRMIRTWLKALPAGPVIAPLPAHDGAARGRRGHRSVPRRCAGVAAARTAAGASRAAMCATPRGSSGRCSKPRSRTTSSPTFPCATNRSTAPIRVTIFKPCARCY